jgi:hypothetical protein
MKDRTVWRSSFGRSYGPIVRETMKKIVFNPALSVGWDSSVGMGTRYGLDGGARFSASVQTDPEAHPTSCTMVLCLLHGVKRLRRGADHPPSSSAEVKERVELFLYSYSGPSWSVLG